MGKSKRKQFNKLKALIEQLGSRTATEQEMEQLRAAARTAVAALEELKRDDASLERLEQIVSGMDQDTSDESVEDDEQQGATEEAPNAQDEAEPEGGAQ